LFRFLKRKKETIKNTEEGRNTKKILGLAQWVQRHVWGRISPAMGDMIFEF
jgi:hypothetical protein